MDRFSHSAPLLSRSVAVVAGTAWGASAWAGFSGLGSRRRCSTIEQQAAASSRRRQQSQCCHIIETARILRLSVSRYFISGYCIPVYCIPVYCISAYSYLGIQLSRHTVSRDVSSPDKGISRCPISRCGSISRCQHLEIPASRHGASQDTQTASWDAAS